MTSIYIHFHPPVEPGPDQHGECLMWLGFSKKYCHAYLIVGKNVNENTLDS